MDGIGEGLAAFAFWGFITALCVAGVWGDAKKRQAQHETLRRMLEGNKPVDEALMTRLMGADAPQRPDRALAISAIIVFAVAIGLVVLAAALSGVAPRAFMPLLGSAGLTACLAGGLKVASGYVRRTLLEDEAHARGRNAG
jgi:hypothetical protein